MANLSFADRQEIGLSIDSLKAIRRLIMVFLVVIFLVAIFALSMSEAMKKQQLAIKLAEEAEAQRAAYEAARRDSLRAIRKSAFEAGLRAAKQSKNTSKKNVRRSK